MKYRPTIQFELTFDFRKYLKIVRNKRKARRMMMAELRRMDQEFARKLREP